MSSSKNENHDDASDLPPGWTRAYSRSQKRYFWSHLETKTSQWHPPTKDEVENPAKAKKIAEEKARVEREQMEKERVQSKRKHSSSSRQRKKKRDPDPDSDEEVTAGFSLGEKTNVAIIVPFRDLHPEQNRSKHLEKFIPYMVEFLRKAKSSVGGHALEDYHIYIVEQTNDKRKFNRGKLLNIGFDYAKRARPHDVFIFHDVDLLPGDDLASWYSRFPKRPIHIARCWDRYSNNKKYFGGIVSFSASDMRRINVSELCAA